MMQAPQSTIIQGGRLHLHHGPIDLIINAWGQDKAQAFAQAEARFQTVLGELVEELDALRSPAPIPKPMGKIARAMANAAAPHSDTFVTPMAAVAGAVADEILAAMVLNTTLTKATANNGGDISFLLTPGHSLTAAAPDASITLHHDTPARGLATSGCQGRSHSFGIADSVTVLAKTAAKADVAATLIANAVNLPEHPGIAREPANHLAPDSDLGDRSVTIRVPPLATNDIQTALAAGQKSATIMLANGLITGAILHLQGRTITLGTTHAKEPHARLHTA